MALAGVLRFVSGRPRELGRHIRVHGVDDATFAPNALCRHTSAFDCADAHQLRHDPRDIVWCGIDTRGAAGDQRRNLDDARAATERWRTVAEEA
jgi:hypothetical protein